MPQRKSFKQNAQRNDEQNSAEQAANRDDDDQHLQPRELQVFARHTKISNLEGRPGGLVASNVVGNAPPDERNPEVRDQKDDEENAVNAFVELFGALQDFYSLISDDKDENRGATVKAERVNRRFGLPRERHLTGAGSFDWHDGESAEQNEEKLVISVKLRTIFFIIADS